MLFSDKITTISSLGLYEINSKARLDLTALTQNKLSSFQQQVSPGHYFLLI